MSDHPVQSSSLTLAGDAATAALGRWLAGHLQAGDQVLLDGPLGAGKTTLTRALVSALNGDPDQVASPTFTLLHQYEADLPVIHVDAYRLSSADELAAIGFDELSRTGVACVEWPSKVEELFDRLACWQIRLEHIDPEHRQAFISAPDGRAMQALPERTPGIEEHPDP